MASAAPVSKHAVYPKDEIAKLLAPPENERPGTKLRRLLQTAAERTIAQLWTRIGACVELFKPQECANYFRHAGYRYT